MNIRNSMILFILIAIALPILGVAEDLKINREAAGLQLEMSIPEVNKVFQMKEQEDGIIALMRKFGFGDPEKQKKIEKAVGKQVFALKGNFPTGVDSIEVFFKNGILYQIALHYGKDYVHKVDWDIFTLPAVKKYGQPVVHNNIQDLASFSYQWADERTKLEIAKGGTISKDKNRFTTSIYNVFYTDIETYRLIKKAEETEKETSDIPKF